MKTARSSKPVRLALVLLVLALLAAYGLVVWEARQPKPPPPPSRLSVP